MPERVANTLNPDVGKAKRQSPTSVAFKGAPAAGCRKQDGSLVWNVDPSRCRKMISAPVAPATQSHVNRQTTGCSCTRAPLRRTRIEPLDEEERELRRLRGSPLGLPTWVRSVPTFWHPAAPCLPSNRVGALLVYCRCKAGRETTALGSPALCYSPAVHP